MVSLCQLGAGLAAASLAVCMLSTGAKKQFLAALTPEQAAAYRAIARERLAIYLASLAAGGVLGWLVLLSSAERDWAAVCRSLGVATAVAYFSYRLWPKQRWMLHYLTTPQQTHLWLAMYRTSSHNYHAGFLLGLAGYGLFLRGLCGK